MGGGHRRPREGRTRRCRGPHTVRGQSHAIKAGRRLGTASLARGRGRAGIRARGRDRTDRGWGLDCTAKGEAAGFKAGVANGHHLVNKSKRDAVYLEVGTRAKRERAHYPDIDLVYEKDESGFRFSRRSGEPYPKSGG